MEKSEAPVTTVMSPIYDKLVRALRSGAPQQGTRVVRVNEQDWKDLVAELGVAGSEGIEQGKGGVRDGSLWTPGSWLLQIPVVIDEKLPQGEVVLEVKTWEWM